ncbi:hypothetical protein [Pseudomonas sp. KCJK8521]|uniref:hypothetical protein n=1 Tax=Pseudomonas TaxID=286 RepID=UPI003905D384
MDLLTNIPSWGDIERNLEQKFNEPNQSVDSGLNSAHEAMGRFQPVDEQWHHRYLGGYSVIWLRASAFASRRANSSYLKERRLPSGRSRPTMLPCSSMA